MNDLLDAIRSVALRYKEQTGKPLGVTGELGELAAAEALQLTLAPARQAGWDATGADGARYQIKSRVGTKSMVPSINLKHDFDAVLLVIFDPATLQLAGIYELTRAEVEKRLAEPGSRARSERNALSVPWFKSNSRRLV